MAEKPGDTLRAKVVRELPNEVVGAEIQLPDGGPKLYCTSVRLLTEDRRREFMAWVSIGDVAYMQELNYVREFTILAVASTETSGRMVVQHVRRFSWA
ncbi:MAG TPA: hypothetical protein VNG90_04030 [Candidatus Acidoferrum sp.]|nr:hypothetical protein [Candidatus Acidoferrum sp.]